MTFAFVLTLQLLLSETSTGCQEAIDVEPTFLLVVYKVDNVTFFIVSHLQYPLYFNVATRPYTLKLA